MIDGQNEPTLRIALQHLLLSQLSNILIVYIGQFHSAFTGPTYLPAASYGRKITNDFL